MFDVPAKIVSDLRLPASFVQKRKLHYTSYTANLWKSCSHNPYISLVNVSEIFWLGSLHPHSQAKFEKINKLIIICLSKIYSKAKINGKIVLFFLRGVMKVSEQKSYNLGILDSHSKIGKLDTIFCRKSCWKTKNIITNFSNFYAETFWSLDSQKGTKKLPKIYFIQVKLEFHGWN